MSFHDCDTDRDYEAGAFLGRPTCIEGMRDGLMQQSVKSGGARFSVGVH